MSFDHVIRLISPSNSTDVANLTGGAFLTVTNLTTPFWHPSLAEVSAIGALFSQVIGGVLGLVLIFVNIMAYRRRVRQDHDHLPAAGDVIRHPPKP